MTTISSPLAPGMCRANDNTRDRTPKLNAGPVMTSLDPLPTAEPPHEEAAVNASESESKWTGVARRGAGLLTVVGGVLEVTAGVALAGTGMATSWAGVGIPVAATGGLFVAHGIDTAMTGVYELFTAENHDTQTVHLLKKMGASDLAAHGTDVGIGLLSGGGVVRSAGGLISKAAAAMGTTATKHAGRFATLALSATRIGLGIFSNSGGEKRDLQDVKSDIEKVLTSHEPIAEAVQIYEDKQ